MADREAGNWLKGFQFYTQESEAPDRFLLWAALGAIAGATQRQVWITWAYKKWYPNLYVMLVGPTGSRKTTALNFARDMIRAVGVPISSDVLSKEAMIEQMVERNKMKKPPRSALTVTVSEFMTFFQVSGLPMVEFLTDVWDCHDRWEYATKKRGTEEVHNIFMNMLAATTPAWISETFTPAFTEHGFAGRNLWIAEEGPRFRKARPKVSPEMQKMYGYLLADLSHITTLRGEFQWSKDAEDYFDNYYEQEYPKEAIDYRLKGYLERKPTQMLKVGMLLSLSDRDALVLEAKHLEIAKTLLEQIEPRMVKAFSSVGRNVYAADQDRIYNNILRAGSISDEDMRRENAHAMDKQKLEEILENLRMMGLTAVTMKNGKLHHVPRKKG